MAQEGVGWGAGEGYSAVFSDPEVTVVDVVVACTTMSPPAYTFFETPIPPDVMIDPVVVVEASVVSVAVAMSFKVVTPVTVNVPPMLPFSATPRPPAD